MIFRIAALAVAVVLFASDANATLLKISGTTDSGAGTDFTLLLDTADAGGGSLSGTLNFDGDATTYNWYGGSRDNTTRTESPDGINFRLFFRDSPTAPNTIHSIIFRVEAPDQGFDFSGSSGWDNWIDSIFGQQITPTYVGGSNAFSSPASFVSVVPEPSSLAGLFVLACTGLGFRRRRK